jgi:hypothetical protein
LLQYGFAKYLTPHGTLLEARGVIPDWIVNLTRPSLLMGGDPQLTAGLKKLSERITAARRPPVVGRITVRAPLYGDPKRSVDGDPKKTVVTVSDAPPPPPKPVPVRQPTENATASESAPSSKQLIEKYLDAVGGEKALLSVTSRVSIGTVEISAMGLTGKAELYEQSPNKSALIMSIEGLGVMRQTSDGNARWLQDPLAGFIRQPLAASDQTDDKFHREIALRKLGDSFNFAGHAKVGAREALILSRRLGSGPPERLFFDAETGLLLRRSNTYYEDYREVDGVKVPFTTREETAFGFVVLRMREIKHNVPIDNNKFVEVPDCFTGPVKSSRELSK